MESPETSPLLDRPVGVRAGEELDLPALEGFFRERLPRFRGEIRVRQFPSGFSNLTYLVAVGERELVLRRPPFGADIKSAHDMGREFKILSSLAPSYPKAPEPLVYCDDPSVLGAPFYLMERVTGVILRPRMSIETAPAAETMAGIANALIQTLTELHAIEVGEVGLADLGRPEGYARRQVEGWSKRYLAARTDDIPAIEKAMAWLGDAIPSNEGAALIHNDFKYDNLVLEAPDLDRVVAVLDWEMATVGDPRLDLGTSLGYWVDPDDPPEMLRLELSPTTLPGNPTRLAVAERYAELTGQNLDQLVFYYVYGVFKIAVIIQQIYSRYLRGDTRDPRFASLIEGVRQCGLMAVQAISKNRINRLFD